MKKTITAFLAIVAILAAMTVPAFAAETENIVTDVRAGTRLVRNPEAPYEEYYTQETAIVTFKLSEEDVYNRLIVMKEQYPDGMRWTDDDRYSSGIYNASGCFAFALIMQEAMFPSYAGVIRPPSRQHTDVNNIRVGDHVRFHSHSMIVLGIEDDFVTLAEGNINKQIMWGRKYNLEAFKQQTEYIISYYPEDFDPANPFVTYEYSGTTARVILNIAGITVPAAAEAAPAAPVATEPAPMPAAPTVTAPAAPAATEPAPAPAAPTVTAPAAAATNAQGTLTVTNNSNGIGNARKYHVTIGDYDKTIGSGRDTNAYKSFNSAYEAYGFRLTAPAGSTVVTVTYAGATVTLNNGQTAEITASGVVTIR